MNNEFITNELINKVNQELNKFYNYIMENEDAFHSMNLKLHSAFYNVSDLLDKYPIVKEHYYDIYDIDNLFYDFCENSYNDFLEYLNENNIEFKPSYIGMTSSFYLSNNYQWIENYRFSKNPLDSITQIYGEIMDKWSYYDIPEIKADKFEVDTICGEVYSDDYINNLKYIASGLLLKDCIDELQPIITQYNYIKDFKENQVEYLKEYMQFKNDIIIDEIEAEKQKELNIWL